MSIDEFAPEENSFIEQLKIGLEILIKLAIFDGIKTPERYSNLRSHHKKKSLVHTDLIHEAIKKSEQNENNLPFRPAQMRLKLSDDLRSIPEISFLFILSL